MENLVELVKGDIVFSAYSLNNVNHIELENTGMGDFIQLSNLSKKDIKYLISGLENLITKPASEVLNGINIFTDGGNSMKTGNGGWAFIVVENNNIIYQNYGRDVKTTNNIMEMTAFYNALQYVHDNYDIGTCVTIISDSQYVVKGFNSWMHSWYKNNWQGTNGEVKNKELWQNIYKFKDINVKVKWVKAHNEKSGSIESYYNNIVDKLTRD